uniref:Uncharacterized protein n=1 Tax=viral metagenome TaxID=1070528 RepID=A0A6C0IXP4_9ZZZZ
MKHPVVVSEGPHAGLYVPLKGQFAYVKAETRPYASPFNTVIYDSDNGVVFYTSSPHTLVANPAYTVASQSAQDAYAYFYQGNMPYCNGVVHAVRNCLTTDYIIITREKFMGRQNLRRRPMTPETAQGLQKSTTPTNAKGTPRQVPVYKMIPVEHKLDDEWLERVDVDELLQDFIGLGGFP